MMWLIYAGIVVILATGIFWISRPETQMGNESSIALVEALVARLCKDESWQGNLTDGERAHLIEAAQRRLENALKTERAQLVGSLRTINQSMANLEGSQRADVFNSLILGFRL